MKALLFPILVILYSLGFAVLVPEQNLRLEATFENISVEWYFIDPAPEDCRLMDSATLEYRRGGETEWRKGHPLAIIANIPMDKYFDLYTDGGWELEYFAGHVPDYRLAGSILSVDKHTAYEIKATLYTRNGAPRPVYGAITTKNDTVVSAGRELYVDSANGNDGFSGLSKSEPKKTIMGLVQAGLLPGDVIHIGPGRYYESVHLAGLCGRADNYISFRADSGPVILDGSIKEIAGGWPDWTFYSSDSDGNAIYFMPQNARPRRVFAYSRVDTAVNGAFLAFFSWRFSDYDLYSLARNETELNRYGVFAWDSSAQRLYVTLPAGCDSSNTTFNISEDGSCISLENCGYLRFTGITFQRPGRFGISMAGSKDIVIDSCFFEECEAGVYTGAGADSLLSENCVISHCRFIYPKAETWRKESAQGWGLLHSSYNHIHGINLSNAGTGWVIRYSEFRYLFNGIFLSHEYTDGDFFNPRFFRNMDIHDNRISFIGDDGIEPEGACVNVRIYRNKLDHVYMGLADTPITVGPVYFFRNTITNWGAYSGEGYAIKAKPYGVSLHDFGITYHYHNTFFAGRYSASWIINVNNDFYDTYMNNLFVSNYGTVNLVPVAQYVDKVSRWFDYNSYYNKTLQPYLSGCHPVYSFCHDYEPHGLFDTVNALPAVVDADPDAPDLHLGPLAAEIDKGAPIPGINDDYIGRAPDIGAYESGRDIGVERRGTGEGPENGFHIYPNPFNPLVTIHLNGPARHSRISFYDLAGHLVRTRDCRGRDWIVVNFTGLPSGLYLAELEASGKRQVKKVVFRK